MEEKKDIGKYIRDRLESADGFAPEALWDRIDDTLERKKKRRKRFFWLIFSTVGLVVVGIVYFGSASGDSEMNTNKSNDILSEELNSEYHETNVNAFDSISKNEKGNKETDDSEVNGEIEKRKVISKQKTILDSFTESETTYYYYRSSDEQEVITNDRTKVDSVIKEYNDRLEREDSLEILLPVKKKDSK